MSISKHYKKNLAIKIDLILSNQLEELGADTKNKKAIQNHCKVQTIQTNPLIEEYYFDNIVLLQIGMKGSLCFINPTKLENKKRMINAFKKNQT